MFDRVLSGELDHILKSITRTGTDAGSAVIDPRGTIRGVSAELAELLHTSRKDLIDTPVWAHDMEMTPEQFEMYRDRLHPGQWHTRGTVIERRDISQFPARVSSALLTVDDVEVLLWLISDDYRSGGHALKDIRHLVSLLPRTTNPGSTLSQN